MKAPIKINMRKEDMCSQERVVSEIKEYLKKMESKLDALLTSNNEIQKTQAIQTERQGRIDEEVVSNTKRLNQHSDRIRDLEECNRKNKEAIDKNTGAKNRIIFWVEKAALAAFVAWVLIKLGLK